MIKIHRYRLQGNFVCLTLFIGTSPTNTFGTADRLLTLCREPISKYSVLITLRDSLFAESQPLT